MLPLNSRLFYLHGFGSSPLSRKATYLTERFGELGIHLEVPDLAENDFPHLTITRQLRLLDELIGSDPVSLIGSSLGGYLTALYAAAHQNVKRVVLLAPAFNFYKLWKDRLTADELTRWKRDGTIEVFNYVENRSVKLWYEFLQDAERYPAYPELEQPGLIIHGNADPTVPVQFSEEFARAHASVRLIRATAGHELTEVLDDIWLPIKAFLLDGKVPAGC